MTRYIIAVVCAAIALSFYITTYFWPTYIPATLNQIGVILALFGVHIGLKRTVSNHTIHVLILVFIAGLYTLLSNYSEDSIFLIALILLHIFMLLAVILTFPFAAADEKGEEDSISDFRED
ncbi:hypothetical protein C3O71_12545 [Cronobacter sakazakii]|uniref:hypothetical protein n=1 Tax=Cronobacter sakazakii TaxID=28141 RepID=UPI000CFC9937|nr:hypothetical protein [Cronobacter sakazakii]RRA27387.1 hypothetical protein C3O71_12545 [Cronobacter sakazakii]RRA44418.1 hypothetical protein C3O73_13935 [Cronobacter sakazakii]